MIYLTKAQLGALRPTKDNIKCVRNWYTGWEQYVLIISGDFSREYGSCVAMVIAQSSLDVCDKDPSGVADLGKIITIEPHWCRNSFNVDFMLGALSNLH